MKLLITCTSLILAALSAGQALAQPPARPAATSPASAYPVPPAPGLYQALGERQGIRLLMDDFARGLRADPRIGTQFADTNLDNLAQSLTEQVCQLAGGPCTYQGPDMRTAHEGMDITRADFNALVEVLQNSMDARGIPFGRQNQLLSLLAPMHRDVITVR